MGKGAFCGENAAVALEKVLPYLVLKRDVAEVAIEMQNDIRRHHGKIGRAAILSDATMALRVALVDRAKYLNSGRWAAATTERDSSRTTEGSDSLNCDDGKVAEDGRNDHPVSIH